MPLWWDRLFNPDDYYGATSDGSDPLSPAAAREVELRTALEDLDVWELPTVVAGRELVANTTAMLPLVAHNGRERLDPVPTICRRPNPSEPTRATFERVVNDLTRHGNAWLRVTAYGSDRYPLALEVVDARRVRAELDDTRSKIIGISIDGRPLDAAELRDIRHIPMLLDGSPLGVSPLAEVEATLLMLSETYRFSAQHYGTGALPPYAIVSDRRLTAAQAAALRDQWATARAERRPAVLSGDISLEQYSPVSASDAMLIDAVNYLDAVVARVMLIPPSLLNTLAQSSLSYSTTEGEFRRWLTLGLYPLFLSRIEAAWTEMLPRGTEALFDSSNLVRMDLTTRIAAYSDAIAADIYSTAEVRALEGLPATPEAAPSAVSPNIGGI